MDIFKEYIQKLRNVSLAEPYIILNDDIAPELKHYIRLLDEIKFEDGSYHTYYGEIKTILNSFIDLWTEVMDEAIKEADRCINTLNKEELMKMMDKTILMHKKKQADFEQQFLPTKNALEDETFKTIRRKFETLMEQLDLMKEELNKLDKQSEVESFVKEHFPISLKRNNDIDRIHVSLEEISNRLKNNVRAMQEITEVNISHLLIRLYEKNKEHLMLSREDIRSSVELAEVQRSMEIIKDKIQDCKHVPIKRLQEEFQYWQAKMNEFRQIEKTFKKVQAEEKQILEQEKLYNSMKDTEIPATKMQCWESMGQKLKQNLDTIQEQKSNAAKALVTFFSVRGPDRIFYSDNIGTYFVDEYGHQCYVYDYGLKNYHVNCNGEFIDKPDKDRYYYDNMGRFITDEHGRKLYQVAHCSSTYKIEKDTFVKVSEDCGHSERVREKCGMQIKIPNDEDILSNIEPVDIKGKLDPEVVKYLWNTFGHVLPEILYDVAENKPKNPIHHIARRFYSLKFKTDNELSKMKQESLKYRDKIHKDRKEKMNEEINAWRAKQVKRRKPEESDEAENIVYNAHMLQQDFVKFLENYDN